MSTCLLITQALCAPSKINKNNRKIFDPVVYLTNNTDINSGSPPPVDILQDTKINTNISINNNNNSSPKFTDGNNANSKAFNEWLAGLNDGDGCFQLATHKKRLF